MKIAVCIKEVPAGGASMKHDQASHRLVRDGDQILNTFDTHAVEAAVQLKESGDHGDVHVVAVLMGPEGSSRTVQKALALGADEAVHVSDAAIAGSDILATSRVLAATIKALGVDLVLMGQQAGDSDCWALPGCLGEMIGVPVFTQVSSMQLAGGEITIERQTEAGYEKLKGHLPVVVSVSDAMNTPRYPSLKAIMGAKKKPVETRSLESLGLDASLVGDAGSGTVVFNFNAPPAKQAGIKIEDDGASAEKIVEFLKEKSLI